MLKFNKSLKSSPKYTNTFYAYGFLSKLVNTTSKKNEPKHKTFNVLDIANNEIQYDEILLDTNNEIEQSATVSENHENNTITNWENIDNEEWVLIDANNEIEQSATVSEKHESNTITNWENIDNEKWVMVDSQSNSTNNM